MISFTCSNTFVSCFHIFQYFFCYATPSCARFVVVPPFILHFCKLKTQFMTTRHPSACKPIHALGLYCTLQRVMCLNLHELLTWHACPASKTRIRHNGVNDMLLCLGIRLLICVCSINIQHHHFPTCTIKIFKLINLRVRPTLPSSKR